MHNNKVIEAWHTILLFASFVRCYYALWWMCSQVTHKEICYSVCFFTDEVVLVHERRGGVDRKLELWLETESKGFDLAELKLII